MLIWQTKKHFGISIKISTERAREYGIIKEMLDFIAGIKVNMEAEHHSGYS